MAKSIRIFNVSRRPGAKSINGEVLISMQGKWKYGIALLAAALVGYFLYNKYRVAPAIEMQAIRVIKADGSRESMEKYLGRPAVISFAASWCGPCRKEITEMGRVADQITNVASVVIISDEDHRALDLLRSPGSEDFDFLKLDGRFSDLSIYSIPTTYLLNSKGQIVKKHTGYIDWSDPSSRTHMLALLSQ